MSEVFDQPQLDVQLPENAVQMFEERGESLEGHMERGSIENCPVMGRMSGDAQQFIVSRVVEHAEQASTFKGMSMADILAKKRQENIPKVEAPKLETTIEPVMITPESYLHQIEIKKKLDQFTTETTEIEQPSSIHQEQITIKDHATTRAKTKPNPVQKLVSKNNARPPMKHRPESSMESSQEAFEPVLLEEKPKLPKVKKVRPTATRTRFKKIHQTKKKLVSIPETAHPEVTAPIIKPPTEVEITFEPQDRPTEVHSVQPFMPETIQEETDRAEVSTPDRFPKTEAAIERTVEEALFQIEEILLQPDFTQTTVEMTSDEVPIATVMTEIAEEILNLSVAPVSVQELKQTIVALIAQRSDILEQFEMKIVWPHIERLIEAIQTNDANSSEYLNRLNSDGTHEHKFFALWQGKSLNTQTDRYNRVSSFILGSAYTMSA